MKIAIVAPSPVPFIRGGAEYLYDGMHEAINKYTHHQCELIKIPVLENNFWNLIDSYYKLYKLDLSYFDMIISTKYPSWMVQHKNHILYMLHPLRGLYDTYNDEILGKEIPLTMQSGLVKEILHIVEKTNACDVELLFNKLFELRQVQNDYSNKLFEFPGCFIKKIIHFFDKTALSSDKIQRICTMSTTVKNRIGYFPENADVHVIPPPPKIQKFHSISYDYLFTASRLDNPKRIDLLIKAMQYVPHDIKLKIAGEGTEKNKLLLLAKDDKRIEFLDFVNEEELIDLYANSLAVLFIPYQEDYGFITIESMMSAKPVITTYDSGGPLEFVIHNETGFVVPPSPEDIGNAINSLISNRKFAQQMGINARQKISPISWDNFVKQLIDDSIYYSKKEKILVLVTYSSYPTRGGGEQRLFNIYSRLAEDFDVTICSIVGQHLDYQFFTLKNGLKQICIPQSTEGAECQWKREANTGLNLYDVLMIDYIDKSVDYVEYIKKISEEASIIIFTHPYLFNLVYHLNLKDKKIVYEAQNVEYLLKKDYVGPELAQKVFDVELSTSQKADVIITTSPEDKENLSHIYNIENDKIFVAPNGVDAENIQLITQEEKIKLKAYVGLTDKPTILFVGSWHPPNLEALNFIIDHIANKYTQYYFLVIGGIKDYYLHEGNIFPENVLAVGNVTETEKYELYKLADIALNPMFSGSGTNLKMIDYMSAGIPTITTSVGARGLEIVDGIHALVRDAESMPSAVSELVQNVKLQKTLRINGRKHVDEKYSWEIIARSIKIKLKEIV